MIPGRDRLWRATETKDDKMAIIHILDHQTIDKIAAGEVVERPSSVVKELVENAIDAGAGAVTVEIKDGGVSFIRVTDNGNGIERGQVRNAFLRHATSKISSAEDLTELVSLGFRGEALASIAAVSMVELISKTREDLTGIRYVIEGGDEKEQEEIGAPDGTTVLVRNLFYNTPPRKKFLKQPQTEGSYVADLMEHLAMSNPQISFKFVSGGQTKFYTTGDGDLAQIIYRIYGREIANGLMPFHHQAEGVAIDGLLGRPVINRANRNYEIFYINGRYVKSSLISRAVEEGYREYLMQHKFPFCVLHFRINTDRIDVNVHPAKMEVRIADGSAFYELVKAAIHDALHGTEMIPEVVLTPRAADSAAPRNMPAPEPFESRRIAKEAAERTVLSAASDTPGQEDYASLLEAGPTEQRTAREPVSYGQPLLAKAAQTELFADKILSPQTRAKFEIIGQLFDTYWLVSYEEKLLIIDQHAAHEKVQYERFLKRFHAHAVVSQAVNPPLIVTLSGRERECYLSHATDFEALGFVVEEFGGNDYAVRGVPLDLYGYGEQEFFREILEELSENAVTGTPETVRTRIAAMACKAAVKGNMRLSLPEAERLIDELLTLDNPYNCPHGRPTIVSMTKYELEKKFKRIVT